VVGINYELLAQETVSRRNAVTLPSPGNRKPRRTAPERTATNGKIITFPAHDRHSDEEASAEIEALKTLVQQAIDALADGKQVVAYQLLQTLLTKLS